MRIGNILRYNIKVLDENDNVLYEGLSDEASTDIKEMDYKEVVELNPAVMIVRV